AVLELDEESLAHVRQRGKAIERQPAIETPRAEAAGEHVQQLTFRSRVAGEPPRFRHTSVIHHIDRSGQYNDRRIRGLLSEERRCAETAELARRPPAGYC